MKLFYCNPTQPTNHRPIFEPWKANFKGRRKGPEPPISFLPFPMGSRSFLPQDAGLPLVLGSVYGALFLFVKSTWPVGRPLRIKTTFCQFTRFLTSILSVQLEIRGSKKAFWMYAKLMVFRDDYLSLSLSLGIPLSPYIYLFLWLSVSSPLSSSLYLTRARSFSFFSISHTQPLAISNIRLFLFFHI